MRQLKYRAWDNIEKEWLLGYQMQNLGGFSLMGETVMMGEWSAVLGEMMNGTFGQHGEELKVTEFTGVLDKNGKEVYEGDIVKRMCMDEHCNLQHTGVVEYSDMWSMFGIKDPEQVRGETERPVPLSYGNGGGQLMYPVEVVGNIFENPELIDKK